MPTAIPRVLLGVVVASLGLTTLGCGDAAGVAAEKAPTAYPRKLTACCDPNAGFPQLVPGEIEYRVPNIRRLLGIKYAKAEIRSIDPGLQLHHVYESGAYKVIEGSEYALRLANVCDLPNPSGGFSGCDDDEILEQENTFRFRVLLTECPQASELSFEFALTWKPYGEKNIRVTRVNIEIDCAVAPPAPRDQRILFASDRDGDFEIFRADAEGDHTQLTHNDVFDGDPAWSPDRVRIAFVSNRTGSANIHTMHADGDSVAQVTDYGPSDSATDPTWSPDGRLAYIHYEGTSSQLVLRTVRVLAAGGGGLELLRVGAQQSLSRPTWLSSGRITFTMDGGLHDIAADGSEDTPTPVLDVPDLTERDADRGPDDALVFVQSGEDPTDEGIFRMTDSGPQRILAPELQVTLSHPALNASGTRIVYVRRDELAPFDLWRIYTANIDGSDPRQIPGQAGRNISPDW